MSTDLDDLDDLLGPDPGASSEEPEPQPNPGSARPLGRVSSEVVQTLHRPVSVTFLSQVMDMDRKTVVKRLTGLSPAGRHRGNAALYDFRQAMQFLVTPKVDVAAYVRKMGVGDLPSALQKDVWDARLKEQKWRQNAGELWPTSSVLEVLGEAFQRLKTTTQLWVDEIAEVNSLPTEVRTELVSRVDGLQAELHKSLVEMPKERSTESQLAELDPEEGLANVRE